MKIYMLYSLLASSLVTLSGCYEEEQIPISQETRALTLDVELSQAGTRQVIERTAFENGDALGLYVTDGTSLYQAGYANLKAAYKDAMWSVNPQALIDNRPATVYAYYPYESSRPAALTGDSPVISISAGKADYLWGTCNAITSLTPDAHLVMHHALACVRFTLSQENCLEGCRLEKIAVTGTGVGTSADLSLKNGSLSNVVKASAGLVKTYEGNVSFLTSQLKQDFLMIPMTLTSSSAKFTFTIDGTQYELAKEGVQLQAGYIYNFPVKYIGRQELVIGDPTATPSGLVITDWNTGANGYSYTGWI